MIFKRRVDIDFAIFEQELLENRLNKIKIHKIQQIDDLIKINSVTDSFTDEFFDSEYFDYTHCLFAYDDEIKIKTISGRISIRKFETSFGLMVTSNRGEWGGRLYNITEYGAEEAGSGNFVGIFEYKDKLYALDTLSHLSMNTCRLHEIKKHENEFEDIVIFESDDLTFGGYYLEDNYLYFHSDSWDFPGLYKFNLDTNELTLIKENLSCGIRVKSLIKHNNYIYLLGFFQLIKYDLKTQKRDIFIILDDDELERFYEGDINLIKC